MTFGAGIEGQGKPFEAFVQRQLPEGTLDLNAIKSNFKTYDHLTPEGMGVSTKTLDTNAVTYQNPNKITSRLNGYVDDMLNFTGDGKVDGLRIAPDQILSKQMQLGIPTNASPEQLAAIAESVKFAQSKGVQLIVTKVK